MTYDISKLPTVQAQLEAGVAALKERHQVRAKAMAERSAPQYARAPESPGPQEVAGRPPAAQGRVR